jgi:hypothetical protein
MTSINRRLSRVGLICSSIYVLILTGGVSLGVWSGWITTGPVSLNELGDLLAGAFGPLAIFWLILGFYQQGEELGNSVEALKLQAEELKNSVSQQKAMVEVTERQLVLDTEARAEQNRISLIKDVPLIQLRAGGYTSSSGVHEFSFLAKNIGGAAETITLSLDRADLRIYPKEQLFTGAGEEFPITIGVDNVNQFAAEMPAELKIVAANLRKQVRKQTFLIGNFHPKALSCEPEQA